MLDDICKYFRVKKDEVRFSQEGKDTDFSPGAQCNDSINNLDEPESRDVPRASRWDHCTVNTLTLTLWDPEAEKPAEPLGLLA